MGKTPAALVVDEGVDGEGGAAVYDSEEERSDDGGAEQMKSSANDEGGDSSNNNFQDSTDFESAGKTRCNWCKRYTPLLKNQKHCRECDNNAYKLCKRCKVWWFSKLFKSSLFCYCSTLLLYITTFKKFIIVVIIDALSRPKILQLEPGPL